MVDGQQEDTIHPLEDRMISNEQQTNNSSNNNNVFSSIQATAEIWTHTHPPMIDYYARPILIGKIRRPAVYYVVYICNMICIMYYVFI